MIKKRLLQKLLSEYEIKKLESHLVQSYLKTLNLNYSQSPILNNYLKNFEIDAKLFLEISILNINSLKILEKYLELLIPAKDRKLNGAFFTPCYIVDFIISQIKPKEKDRILDPSCGCGTFLIGIVKYYQKTFNKNVKKIVVDNIFGLDILDYNIHRAKILLSILALQNDEILKEEDFNLIVQDSLRINDKHCFERNQDRLFEAIIGNPPYVKFQDLTDKNREFLANNWETIKNGSFNLYFAFFELGYNLLRDGGTLGYITPNNYFTSLAGESIRKYFNNRKCVFSIIDFSHKKVFDAQTYTAITFLNKKENAAIYYDRINNNQQPETFLKNVNFSPNDLQKLNFKKWRLLKLDERRNIEKIENIGTPINKLFDICVGIATLKDELYFIDSIQEKNGYYLKSIDNKVFEIEKSITRNIYKISDFKSQEECNHNTRKIIFPYKIIAGNALPIIESELEKEFPRCYRYFKYIKEILQSRDKGKVQYKPFYVYGRTQGLTKTGKKILTPTFSKYPRFIIVEEENAFFCNGYGLYFKEDKNTTLSLFNSLQYSLSKVANIKLVKKILNSYVMHYYISKTSVSIEGGYPCYQKNFIEKFTIPGFTDDEFKILDELNKPEKIDKFLIEKYQLNLLIPNLSE